MDLCGMPASQQLGVSFHRTTAYHPQANCLCESFHQSMKVALRVGHRDLGDAGTRHLRKTSRPLRSWFTDSQ